MPRYRVDIFEGFESSQGPWSRYKRVHFDVPLYCCRIERSCREIACEWGPTPMDAWKRAHALVLRSRCKAA